MPESQTTSLALPLTNLPSPGSMASSLSIMLDWDSASLSAYEGSSACPAPWSHQSSFHPAVDCPWRGCKSQSNSSHTTFCHLRLVWSQPRWMWVWMTMSFLVFSCGINTFRMILCMNLWKPNRTWVGTFEAITVPNKNVPFQWSAIFNLDNS